MLENITKDELVSPECCEEMIRLKIIYLIMPESFWEGDFETPPTWTMQRSLSPFETDGTNIAKWKMVTPKFCPFCSKALPAIIKKKMGRSKVCRVTDGGDYCNTCKERCTNCTCLRPEKAWKPVKE